MTRTRALFAVIGLLVTSLFLAYVGEGPALAAPEPAWAAALPTVPQVLTAIRGQDAPDTAARQQGAFEILVKYIEALSGVSQFDFQLMPGTAARRLQEYQDAVLHVPGGTIKTQNQAYRDCETYELQKATLDALVARPYEDAYFASPRGRKVVAERQQRAAARDAELQRTAVAAQQIADRHDAQAKAVGHVAPDLAAARKNHVDLSVFGLELGSPADLPACAADATPFGMLGGGASGGDASCRADGYAKLQDGLGGLAAAMTNEEVRFLAVPGTKLGAVRLAATKCPSWIKMLGACLVRVAFDGEIPVAVIMSVDGEKASKVSAQLVKKYGASTGTGDTVQCRNKSTGIVVSHAVESLWALPGLHVSFQPIGPDCGRYGVLEVALGSYHRAETGTRKQHDDSDPSM